MAISTHNNVSGATGQPQLQPLHLLQQSAQLIAASKDLVQAVAERALTDEEAKRACISGNLTERTPLLNKDKAESAQVAFFNAFKDRIKELYIDGNSPLYGNYAHAAQQLIEDCAKTILSKGTVNEIKKEFIIQDFSRRIFNDMVEAFASKPLNEITIDAFKQKVAYLKGFFPRMNLIEIETKLRKAIKAKHDANTFHKIHTSADIKAKLFNEGRGRIEADLKAEKTQLEAELKILCGIRYEDPNGLLHPAYEAFHRAECEIKKTKAELLVAIGTVVEDIKGFDGDGPIEFGRLFLANENTEREYFIRKIDEYNARYSVYFETKIAYERLEQRRFLIAGEQNQYGRLGEIRAALTPAELDKAADRYMAKMGKFYNELSRDVGDVNKYPRARELHKIIN